VIGQFVPNFFFFKEFDHFFLEITNSMDVVEFVCQVFNERFVFKVFDIILIQGNDKSLCSQLLQYMPHAKCLMK
jgi:hypothetical protein